MSKKKTYKKKSSLSAENDSLIAYGNMRIRFFNSFEEENEAVAKERVEIPYDKRLIYIEELRKRIFNNYLLPDGSWPSIKKVFKIMPPYTNEISQ